MNRDQFISSPKIIEVIFTPCGIVFRARGTTLRGLEETHQTFVEGLIAGMLNLDALRQGGTQIIDYTKPCELSQEEIEDLTARTIYAPVVYREREE